jgi:hypothetical protein
MVADTDMEKLREIYVFVCFALGASAIILAVFQAWNGKIASASALGAAFVICGVFLFLSQIRTFKVWEVQVELRETLDRAEEVISRLRQLAAISAKATYMQMAWGNRMGVPSAKDKQAVLDEIDAQLAVLKVNPEDIAAIKRPFVQMIELDFYFLYLKTIRSYAELRYSALTYRANRRDTEENKQARDLHSEKITPWSARTNDPDPFARLMNNTLDDELARFIPRADEWLNAREREIAEELKRLIVRLNSECAKKGGYTEQAANYYDKYHGNTKALAEELFAQPLKELRAP